MSETEEQIIKRKTEYAISVNFCAMRGGNCKHETFIYEGVYGVNLEKPVIALCNNDDSYYIQYFRTKEELGEFIAELQKLSNELWG